MRRIAWVVIPIILVGLLGFAIFTARGPSASTAFTLQAGDCINIPADAQIGDIPTLDCTAPHDAEVFVALKMNDEAPSGPVAYPGASQVAVWVENNCGPAAEEAYAGTGAAQTAGLIVGYFFPDADAWSHGERQVTCYLHASNASQLSAPVRGAATGASASPS